MPKASICIECGKESPTGSRKTNVGAKQYQLCEACYQDRQIREDNVATIRRVLKLEGRGGEPAADKALAAYLYKEITLWELADLIGAPFVTIPVPAVSRDQAYDESDDLDDWDEGIGGSRTP